MKFVIGLLLCATCLHADDVPWALQPIANPPTPAVNDSGWANDPLDRFVLGKLDDAGLKPNPDAARYLLLRRVSFDLTGLPPTPQEINAFINDKDALDAAYAKVVKRLLDSPRFGERWARHWLDVVRYADTAGGERPLALPLAWRYRDWVIDALNADKPYNRFVAEQVAGDLPPQAPPDMLLATGFLALGANDLSMMGKPQFVMDRVHEQIDTTTRAFMGLTVGCARCHDHRGDPVKQTDYYALAGIFLSSKTWFAVGDQEEMSKKPMRSNRGKSPVERESLEGRALLAGINSLASSTGKEIKVGQRSDKVGMMEGNGDDVMSVKQRTLAKISIDMNTCMGMGETAAVHCALRERGDLELVGPLVPRGAVTIPGLPPLSPIREQESGRLQLAAGLTSPANPLTPRVLVNRVWLHLFGRGIVNSPDDFGFMGDAPSHPELLDHLASRFMQEGWSVKKLIRSIVMSRTYRMSSRGDAAKQKVDPANKLLWRMNWKRLEAEALRDAWLQLVGPIAALMTDLKQRSMLDDTLIIWGGEFGRTPRSNNGGRDHNNKGFSMWLAGGGVKGGHRHGDTNDIGAEAADGKVSILDLHATILHLLGLKMEKLTYPFASRDVRLRGDLGRVVEEILA